jgi:ATP-dependent helicase/nuclease subunit A
VHALSRALKERQIDVAGADRLLLASHIAIKDLIALGRFLIQREDDLSLAAILKSPLFGFDEDQLFHLAADRPETVSLFDWMRRKARDGNATLAEAVDRLDRWASEAAFKQPFEFYAQVLGRDQGRRHFISRLGHEAGEILDEFLSFCLAEESVGLPGLEDLLTTLETAGPEIKREMDQGRDEVRILTVHASKGLEAPVVFLVDSGAPPAIDAHLPRLTPFTPETDELRGVEGYLWRSSKDVANTRSRALERELKQRADEEYRRLLYVGMTRARDRLILCGYYNIQKPKPTTWLSIAQSALGEAPEIETAPHPADGRKNVLRFRVTPQRALEPPKRAKTEMGELSLLPAELTRPLPPQEHLPRPLTPSGAALLIGGEDEPAVMRRSPVLDADTADTSALERGRVVHKLLQMLPELEPAQRDAAARRYLERAAGDWPETQRNATLSSVASLLADKRFAPVFASGSAAEVALAGTLQIRGRPRVVSGVVDRLAVTESRILIVDYKTNRPPPTTLADVPEAYVLQLALYTELLKPIYPGRQVEAALLFTESAELMTLPDDVMRTALARLTLA